MLKYLRHRWRKRQWRKRQWRKRQWRKRQWRKRWLAFLYRRRDRATARALRCWIESTSDQQGTPQPMNPMNLEHTPGPWRVRISNGGRASIEHHNGIGLVELADVAAPDGLDRAHANARLMASAPEMREQLDQAHRDETELLQALDKAHRMLGSFAIDCDSPDAEFMADYRAFDQELRALLARRRGQ